MARRAGMRYLALPPITSRRDWGAGHGRTTSSHGSRADACRGWAQGWEAGPPPARLPAPALFWLASCRVRAVHWQAMTSVRSDLVICPPWRTQAVSIIDATLAEAFKQFTSGRLCELHPGLPCGRSCSQLLHCLEGPPGLQLGARPPCRGPGTTRAPERGSDPDTPSGRRLRRAEGWPAWWPWPRPHSPTLGFASFLPLPVP